VISVPLARALRDAGLRWTPSAGDRFVVADRDMDDDVFVVSDMTIEVHQLPQGQVIGFNGTTEWALDSVDDRHAVWLPRENQLRELLAGTFRRLDLADGEWRVSIDVNGTPGTAQHQDPEEAYGLALLYLITGESAAPV
jgi:hypothetical protein